MRIKEENINSIKKIYPLTPLQEGMLFHHIANPHDLDYICQSVFSINFSINAEIAERALELLCYRYDVLRTIIVYQKVSKPQQVVLKDRKLEFEYIDLQQESAKNHNKMIDAIIDADVKRKFDLQKDCLLRVKIINTGNNKYKMIWTHHHIIMDGWCISLLFGDYIRYYQMLQTDRFDSCLKHVMVEREQHPEFSEYIKWVDSQDEEEALNYWRKLLDGYDGMSDIEPFEKPEQSNERTSVLESDIDAEIYKALQDFTICNHVTVNTVLEMVCGLVLQKYNHTNDVVFGKVVSGRPPELEGMEDVIGLFINTIPVRVTYDDNTTYQQLAQALYQQALESTAYEYCSLAEIQNLTKQKSDLIKVLFVFENYYLNESRLNENDDLQYEIYSEREQTNYDIDICFMNEGDGLRYRISYNQNRFSRKEIGLLLKRMKQFLIEVITHQEELVTNLTGILPEEEVMLQQFHAANKKTYPKITVSQMFENQVKRTPDHTAIILKDSRLTYNSLNRKANQLSYKLRAMGLQPGDFAVILAERSFEMIQGIMGCIKAGVVYVPVDASYPLARIQYILDDCKPKAVLTYNINQDIHYTSKIIDLGSEEIWSGNTENPIQNSKTDDLLYCIYTSGTTGGPKGVLIAHQNLINLLYNYWDLLELTPEDVIVQFASIAFDVSVREIFSSLLLGATLLIIPQEFTLDSKLLSDYMNKYGATNIGLTPTLLRELDPENFETLRVLSSGGEAAESDILEQWVKKVRVFNGYGPTETTVNASFYEVREGFSETNVPIGKPLLNTQAYIMSGSSQCGLGIPGELCLAGDGVGKGYLKRNTLTAEKFSNNPFGLGKLYRTGDLARWLPDGVIQYLGRMDDQIKIRGFRIELGEIEGVIRTVDGVKDVAVTAKKDLAGDTQIYAYIVSNRKDVILKVRQTLIAKLPTYMVPASMKLIDQIPVTSNGKLNKRALPEIEIQQRNSYAAPITKTQQMLCEIFSEVLDAEIIGITDDFFALGGHSLKALRLINKIETTFSVRLPLKSLFANPTVEQLSQILRYENQQYQDIPTADNKKYYPASSPQRRLYLLRQLDDAGTAYNMCSYSKLPVDTSIEKITGVFEQLLSRHEILRTEFHLVDGELVQYINSQVTPNFEVIADTKSSDSELLQKFIRPFELNHAPLLRVQMVKRQTDCLLLFDMHHIIGDGISMEILLDEFIKLYHGDFLEPVTHQYKDYSEWMRGRDLNRQREFWMQSLSGDIPVLNMPTDFLRPQLQSYRGDQIGCIAEDKIAAGIRQVCTKTGTTEFMVFLSAVVVLLYKYSKQNDILIGTPVSGRTHHDTEKMLGMFVNTLALRTKFDPVLCYRELLMSVKENWINAFENQDYPLEQIIEEIGGQRDMSRNPIFDVLFSYNEKERAVLTVSDEVAQDAKTGISKFDISIEITKERESYGIKVEYCTDLYKRESMEAFIRQYTCILESISEDLNIPVNQINEIRQDEYHMVTKAFNQTQTDYQEQKTVIELFEEQVNKTPDHLAIILENDTITYRQMNQRANQLAHTLRMHGVKQNDFVAIMATRKIETIIAIYAVLKAGGAYLPIDPDYPKERIEYMLNDAAPKVLLLEDVGTIYHTSAVYLNILDENSYCCDTKNPLRINKAEDLAYLIYTSGTSGKPKGTMIEHRNLHNMIVGHTNIYDLTENDIVLQAANMIFDVSVWDIFNFLVIGATICLVPYDILRNPSQLAKYCEVHKVTITSMTPSLINELDPGQFPFMRAIISAGEAANVNVLKKWTSHCRVFNSYGPTETTVYASSYEYDGRDLKSMPIGKPSANLQFLVLNDNRMVCGIGIPGELCIAGDSLARGYLNNAELTAQKFVKNPLGSGRLYRTGDTVRWLFDGNIEYLGRLDEQIKIRGYRVELKEIDQVIRTLDHVRDVAVITKEDSTGDTRIYAYVVADEKLVIDDLKDVLRNTLPEYMVPSYWMQIECIPLTKNGKLDRKVLPQITMQHEQEYVEPSNTSEQILCKVFCDVLGVERVGINDNFFELGGDSIKAIRAISKLREAGYEITLKDILKYYKVSALVKHMRKMECEYSENQDEVTGTVILSPIMEAFCNFANPDYFNQSALSKISLQDEDKVRSILTALVTHHDILRAVYRDSQLHILSTKESKMFELYRYDFTGRGEAKTEIESACEDIQGSMDIAAGPLLKSAFFITDNGNYLFLCIHHLAVDSVSWRILGEDFNIASEQCLSGKAIRLPQKTASFIAWSNALNEYKSSVQLERQLEYWGRVNARIEAAKIKTLFHSEDKGKGEVRVRINKKITSDLVRKTRNAFNTDVNDILLCGLAMAISNISGQTQVAVGLEGHGRVELHKKINIDRTIGWFTCVYPVILETGSDLRQNIISVKETIREVPNHGIGYGLLKERLSDDHPNIYFNYHGEVDSELGDVLEYNYDTGKEVADENHDADTVIINGAIFNGSLEFVISYSKELINCKQAKQLAAEFENRIIELTNYCTAKKNTEKTKSDLSAFDLSQSDFDIISNSYTTGTEIVDIYPLAPLQEGMLFHYLDDSESSNYIIQNHYDLSGDLDGNVIEASLACLAKKHDTLRTAIMYEKLQKSWQVVMADREIEYCEIDLSKQSGNEQDRRVKQILKDDICRGFDLQRDSLLRVLYIDLGQKKSKFIWTMHHIIVDGWCLPLLFADFIRYYALNLKGINIEKTMAEIQNEKSKLTTYSDYVRWLQKQDKEVALAYFTNMLEGYEDVAMIKPMMLPEQTTKKSERLKAILSKEDSGNLMMRASENYVTVNTIFESVLGLILQKYNNTDDVVFGKVTSGRNAELEGISEIVGLFVNTIPVRVKTAPGQSFQDLIKEQQEQGMSSSQYDYCSLVDIQSRTLQKSKLIQVLLAFENYYVNDEELQINSDSFSYEWNETIEKTNYNITVTVATDENNCLQIEILYDPNMYAQQEIEVLLNHVLQILKMAADNIKFQTQEVVLISEKEKSLILETFNDTECIYPHDMTVVELFEEQVKQSPLNTAVVYQNELITYQELNNKANYLAAILREHGVKPNDFVAVMSDKGIGSIVAIVAILKAGAAYVPIDSAYPEERISYILADCNPKVLISNMTENDWDIPHVSTASMNQWIVSDENLLIVNCADDLAYCMYTSGTTGKPKGSLIEHKNIVKLVINANYVCLNEKTRMLQTGAMAFDASTFEIWGCLLNGGSLHLMSNIDLLDMETVKNYLAEQKINTMFLTTALFNQYVQYDRTMFDPVGQLLFGGEMTSREHVCMFRDYNFNTRLTNVYGPTETTTFASYYPIDEVRVKVPIGKPLSNTKLYIINHGQLCGFAIPGELCIGGDGVGQGYLNRPELTSAKFIDNPYGPGKLYRTGDIARWYPDGNIEFVGRIDGQVKIRGFRIETDEILNTILENQNILNAVVIINEDDIQDKKIHAYVVGNIQLDIAVLKNELRKKLPEYMIPSIVIQIESIPMTPNGKVDKSMLKQLIMKQADEIVDSENETEKMLCGIFSTILRISEISVNDNFFDLGGHSLSALKIINKIEENTGIKLPVRAIFENPSVRELSHLLTNEQDCKYQPLPKAEPKDFYPMSSAQKRIYLLRQMDDDGTAYNMFKYIRINGDMDMLVVESIMQRMIDRHEILRTEFLMIDGKPVQRIQQYVKACVAYTEDSVTPLNNLIEQFLQPFELDHAPLVRLKIVKRTDHCMLLFDMHHIIGDGISLELLSKEFITLLHNEKLEPLTYQYKDYSEWMRRRDDTAEREYWQQILGGSEIPVLDFPTDFPRLQKRTSRGNLKVIHTGQELQKAIKDMCQHTGITEYMLFLSAGMILLHQYSRQEDILIGTPIAGRTHPDVEHMLGMFVNTLVMRGAPTDDKRVDAFLSEMKESCIKALENQSYPFEQLVEDLKVPRDPSRNPLFDVMLAVQNMEESELSGQDLISGEDQRASYNVRFDLEFTIAEELDDYAIQLLYCTDLFTAESVVCMLKHYRSILAQITENTEISIGEVLCVCEEEMDLIVREFNDTDCNYPKEQTIVELFEEQVRKNPDKVAVVYEQTTVTYSELNRRANQLAVKLRNLNIQPHDMVALIAERSIESIIGICGILKAGAAYVPIDASYPIQRIEMILTDCVTKVVLTYRHSLTAERGQIALDNYVLWREDDQNNSACVRAEDLAYCMYTSGTTGKPKGTLIEHRNVVNLVKNVNYAVLDETVIMLQAGALAFDAATFEIWGSLLNGGTLHIIDESALLDQQMFKEYLISHRINTMFLTTALFNQMIQFDSTMFNSVKQLLSGGERASEEYINKLLDANRNTQFIHVYGPTEATTFATFYAMNKKMVRAPIGRPLNNTRIYIMNEMSLCGIGIPGELCIAGDGVARGYLRRDDLNAQKFIDNPFGVGKMYRTRDLARWLPDGNIEYIGRMDEQVKIHGFRIELGEIENLMIRIDGISEAVVLVKEDHQRDKKLFAYFVADEDVSVTDIRDILAKELPGYMIPSYMLKIAQMPLDHNGKIDKKSLPEITMLSSHGYLAPRTAAENCLCIVLADVLGVEKIGIMDSFFEMGGDSIKSIRTVSKLRESGYQISVKNILQSNRVKDIAAKMEKLNDHIEADQTEVTGIVWKTPIIQDFFNKEYPNPNHFNQSMIGKVDIDDERVIGSILEAIAEHHDMLRVVYRNQELEILSVQESKKPELHVCEIDGKRDIAECIQKMSNRVQASINLEKGPLMKAVLFKTVLANYLLICVHHLAIDGVSWRILGEDFSIANEQLKKGLEIKLPNKTTSFQAWGETLKEFKDSELFSREQEYWKSIIDQMNPILFDKIENPIKRGFESVTVDFDKEITGHLTKRAGKAFYAQAKDLLICAVGMTLSSYTGQQNITIGVEGHGREEVHKTVNIDRTIGWFTSIYPVILKMGQDLRKNIITTKEALRAVPNHGLGYGLLNHKPEPNILFNFLGELDAEIEFNGAKDYLAGKDISEDNDLFGILTFNGSIESNRLTFSLLFDQVYLDKDMALKIAGEFKSVLYNLVNFCLTQEHPEKTVSDFTASCLPMSDLEKINKYYGGTGNIEDIYALTPLQEGMLYHYLADMETTEYVIQNVFNINGIIDSLWAAQSLQLLARRHHVLRTNIIYDGISVPWQVISSNKSIEYNFINLDVNSSSIQHGELYDLIKADVCRGFDLQNDSLIRMTHIKSNDNKTRLVWTFHHMIMDGWCISLIFHDYMRYYFLLSEGNSPAEIELLIDQELQNAASYADYMKWIDRKDKTKAMSYWQRMLAGFEEITDIKPVEVPQEDDYSLGRVSSLLDENNSAAICRLAAQNHITVNTVVETALAVLLQYYSFADDVVFGKVTSGRDVQISGIEDVVGLFINTVPVRAVCDREWSFEQYARNLHEQWIESSQYSYCPLAEIQALTPLKSDLIKILYVFENYYVKEDNQNFPDIDMEFVLESAREETNYHLTFSSSLTDQHILRTDILYDSSVYTKTEVDCILNRMLMILEQIAEGFDVKVNNIHMLLPKEESIILEQFNRRNVVLPKTITIASLFEQQATQTPDHVALVSKDQYITYRELNSYANTIAEKLLKIGLNSEDLVAILADRTLETVIGICGILKAGGAYLPIDTSYPEGRIDYILKDSRAVALLTNSWFSKTDIPIITIDDYLDIEPVQANPVRKENALNLAYCIYTSGTTGKPKGSLIENRSVIRLVRNPQFVHLNEQTVILQTGSIAFDASTFEIWGALLNGGTLVLMEQHALTDHEQIKKDIAKYHVNMMWVTASLFNQMIQNDNQLYKDLDYLLIGGEKLSEKYVRIMKREAPGVKLINGYGPTENTTFTCTYEIPAEFKCISIGRPIDNTQVYIHNQFGLCGIGIPGELCTAGDGLSRGYLDNEELTEQKFITNPYGEGRLYCTGDMARWRADGNIEYLGRIDQQIKLHGYRIELGEIEDVLLNISDIDQAVAVAETEDNTITAIAAYLVAQQELDITLIREKIGRILPDYMIPSYFMQIDSIPISINGKLDRQSLPRIRQKSIREYVGPKNDHEQFICDSFREVLGVDKVGVYDEFFELGGDSIKAIRIISHLQERGIKLSVVDIMKLQSPKMIAKKTSADCVNTNVRIWNRDMSDDHSGIQEAKKQVMNDMLAQMSHYAEQFLGTKMVSKYSLSPGQIITYEMGAAYSFLQFTMYTELDLKKIISVWKCLMNEYSVLCSSIMIKDNDKYMEEFNPDQLTDIPYLDFSTYSVEESEMLLLSVSKYLQNYYDKKYQGDDMSCHIICISLSDREQIIIIPITHLIFDGYSRELLRERFMELYNMDKISSLSNYCYQDYVDIINAGPVGIDETEMMNQLELDKFAEAAENYLAYKESLTCSYVKYICKLGEHRLSEIQKAGLTDLLFKEAMKFSFDGIKIPMTVIHMNRQLGEHNFNSHIGEFIDLIPMVYDPDEHLGMLKKAEKIVRIMSNHNISLSALMGLKHLRNKYEQTVKALSALDNLDYYHLKIPMINYLMLYEFDSYSFDTEETINHDGSSLSIRQSDCYIVFDHFECLAGEELKLKKYLDSITELYLKGVDR